MCGFFNIYNQLLSAKPKNSAPIRSKPSQPPNNFYFVYPILKFKIFYFFYYHVHLGRKENGPYL